MSTGVLETATCELMGRYRRDAGQGQPHWEGLRHVALVQRRQALNKRRKHEALHLAAAFEPRPTAAAAPHAPATAGVGLEGRGCSRMGGGETLVMRERGSRGVFWARSAAKVSEV